MKIFITGINGYLGSHITSHLVNAGHQITGLTIQEFDEPNPWNENVDVVVADIRDKEILKELADKQFDALIHLVSLDHHGSEGEIDFVNSINVLPTWNVLDIFTKKNLKKFIYFSTQQVYGRLPNVVVDESYPAAPVNNYGLTHLLSENIVRFYNSNSETDAVSVRLSNSYGSPVFSNNNCWWLVVNDLCQTAFKENSIKLLSDGSPIRDFIHVSDVARAVEKLLMTNTKDEDTFNVSSGRTLSILKLAGMVKVVFKKRYNKDIDVVLKDGNVAENTDMFDDAPVYTINSTKLKSIGFKPEVTIEQGINLLFDYLEKQR